MVQLEARQRERNLLDSKWRANKTKTITLFTQLYAPGVRKNDF